MQHQRSAFAAKVALAFLAGIAIYQTVVFIGGYLAAIAIPSNYFEWFGRSRLELALALVDTATFAIPIVALTTCLTVLTYWLLKAPSVRIFMLAVCLGAMAMYAYWTIIFVLVPPDVPVGVEVYPASVRLKQILMPRWWLLPTVTAPWLGFAIAGLLITQRYGRRA